jgi:acyl-CoA synthetase (AMP-forming)/AMP-acid ligase II
MAFRRAHLNLGYLPDEQHGVNGLHELIEFNAIYNPTLIFGIQQTRTISPSGVVDKDDIGACVITFAELKNAVDRCSAWLVSTGVTPGRKEQDEGYPPAVAILLGSDITIYIYIAALLRIGTPVGVIAL